MAYKLIKRDGARNGNNMILSGTALTLCAPQLAQSDPNYPTGVKVGIQAASVFNLNTGKETSGTDITFYVKPEDVAPA